MQVALCRLNRKINNLKVTYLSRKVTYLAKLCVQSHVLKTIQVKSLVEFREYEGKRKCERHVCIENKP